MPIQNAREMAVARYKSQITIQGSPISIDSLTAKSLLKGSFAPSLQRPYSPIYIVTIRDTTTSTYKKAVFYMHALQMKTSRAGELLPCGQHSGHKLSVT